MTFVWATVAMALASVPAMLATLRGEPLERLLALQVLSADVALLLAALAGANRTAFDLDLALTLALLSFAGALALVRFVGRWA
ncbi:MAG TPA: monovalent cation/H+ antiporter complex subunit F [Anaeromyxobacter sp.]